MTFRHASFLLVLAITATACGSSADDDCSGDDEYECTSHFGTRWDARTCTCDTDAGRGH